MSSAEDLIDRLAAGRDDVQAGPRASAALFWLLCLLPTLPMTLIHIGQLFQLRYAFLPLAVGLVVLLVWRRSETPLRRPQSMVTWIALGIALLLVLVSLLLADPWWSAAAMLFVIGSALRTVRGPLQRSLTSTMAPLLCILGPALAFDRTMASYLDRASAYFASLILDSFGLVGAEGIPHTVAGSAIRLFDGEIVARDVTGGLVNFMAVLGLAFAFLAWKRMSLWLAPLYAFAAFATTLIIYTLQVAAAVLAAEWFAADTTSAFYQIAATLIAATVAALMIYSSHQLIAILFHHIEPNLDAGPNPLVTAWNRLSIMSEPRAMEDMSSYNARRPVAEPTSLAGPLWLVLLGGAAVLVLLTGVQAATYDAGDPVALQSAVSDPFISMTALDSLPESVNELQLESVSGTDSDPSSKMTDHTFKGSIDGAVVTVQVTQPLARWFEITGRFESDGWEVLDRDVVRISVERTVPASGSPADERSTDASAGERYDRGYATARLRRVNGETEVQGYLYFSAIRPDGSIVEAPTDLGSFGSRVLGRLGYASSDVGTQALVQMFVASPERFEPSDIRRLQTSFLNLRDHLSESLQDPDATTAADNH